MITDDIGNPYLDDDVGDIYDYYGAGAASFGGSSGIYQGDAGKGEGGAEDIGDFWATLNNLGTQAIEAHRQRALAKHAQHLNAANIQAFSQPAFAQNLPTGPQPRTAGVPILLLAAAGLAIVLLVR